jgi:hypothetical protein
VILDRGGKSKISGFTFFFEAIATVAAMRQHCFITTMARGSKIHPDIHYIVIRLSSIMKPKDISIYTGISQQSVLRILRHFASHGTVEHKKERKKKDVHLRDMDLEVSFSTLTIAISCSQCLVCLWDYPSEPRHVSG